jgi:hypothetical protein
VRRSSDNAEANIGFATAVQTRTNLAAIPINNNGGSTAPGVTMTTIGTGTEFGQSYIDVRWQGTAGGGGGFLQFFHGAINVPFDPAIHAPVTPGLTYTSSVGFRLVSGTAPVGIPTLRGAMFNNGGSFISGASLGISNPTATLQRNAIVSIAMAGVAYFAPNIYWAVGNGEVVDFTVRFYAANVELGTGNARPLLQRNVPETIADIGDFGAEAVLSFVGGGSGFVTTLYDQSGNGRNATQTTAGNQPRLLVNGVLQTEGGKPAILFDGVDDSLASPAWGVIAQPFSRHYVGVRKSFAAASHWINSVEGSATSAAVYDPAAGQHALYAGGFWGAVTVSLIDNERAVFSAAYNDSSSYMSKNGVLTTGLPGDQGFSGIRIGCRSSTPAVGYANITMQELIVVASGSIISTTNRQTLERNQGEYYGISFSALDQLSAPSAVAYSLRKLRNAYTGNAIRVRRASDNAETDIGFATAVQTRTNLAAIPINNNGGSTAPGVTMTTIGTGTEFGQSYIDVRWQGTSAGGVLQFVHGAIGGPFDPAIHAPVTPGLTYTTSVGFRLVSGTAPAGTPTLRAMMINSGGSVLGVGGIQSISKPTATLQRNAVVATAPANTAYIAPNIYWVVGNGAVVDFTVRFYAANLELGINNARPLLQRNVPETIADIGDLDTAALLAHVGSGSGFVTTWYDQSGNGRNATQATAGQQPRIVNAGVIETINLKPSARWDGSNDSLLLPSGFLFNQSQFSVNMVTQSPGNGLAAVFGPQNTNSQGLELTYHNSYLYPTLIRINGTIRNLPQTSFFSTDNIPTISTLSSTPTVQNGWLNGSVFPSLSGGGNSPLNFNGTYAFGVFDAGRFALMTMAEFIITDTALSTADRQNLERNQGGYYTISVS